MAETLLSPGSLSRENDQSFISIAAPGLGASIIGPTVLGKLGVPRYVTTYSEYENYYGSTFTSGSDEHTFFTSITAYNYFLNGGTNLLVTKVGSGTWAPASSSFVSASVAVGPITGSSIFELETLSDGAIMNSTGTESTGGLLANGTSNNIRWEIINPDTSSGQFSLLIRRGDDTANQKVILEQFLNMSLDPIATNYIGKVIGDYTENVRTVGSDTYIEVTGSYANKSRFVRVKAVNSKTPNFFDNGGIAKSQYTGSIPKTSSGSFGDASGAIINGALLYENITTVNVQGLVASDYTTSIALLADPSTYRYNSMIIPGLNYASHSSTLNTVITNLQNRGDAIGIIDLSRYGATVTDVTTQSNIINSSYAATYWPWLQTKDPNSGKDVWVPSSVMIPSVYAFSDANSEAWFAPAGLTRGGLPTVIRAERKLTQNMKDLLYANKVNPIATFPGVGLAIFGQKTLQTKASALDRVGVRRLLITLKDVISGVSNNLVFEQNTTSTRNSFLNQVNPYLESVQQRQGLYAFKVVMDETNNTADTIDRNELIGQIFLQPTKTAEFIVLDFNILPTGATFPS
jgi:hypothetical protein